MLLERIERFMNEEHPEFIPYVPGRAKEEPATPPRMSTESALDQFARYRTRQLLLLESAEDIIWKKPATHPEYEEYSLYPIKSSCPFDFASTC